ncbi:MAG: hypothetical protein IAF38_06910 [Bacteroidia bacterium]|nr:hypothetical protein [Bacteroidia bacterium]
MNVLTKTLTTDKGINYLNIGLMVLSAALAFYIPFHLFLFAYAVLGPLHYLTEMSWLQKRSFFIANKWDVILFILISLAITLSIKLVPKFGNYNTAFMISSLVFAVFSVFIKNNVLRFILIVVLFVFMASLKVDGMIVLIFLFSVLLPTLIHVYIFTGLFIFYGALKQKSATGILSLVVFILCSVFFFVYVPAGGQVVSAQVQALFQDFKVMNHALLYMFNVGEYQSMPDILSSHDKTLFNDPMAVAVMRFIAFAYCYHYLNWFSKTSVIKWHQVSRTRIIIILVLWVISVACYAYKYQLGFYVLFLLSMIHVMCEFPLNIQTIKGIGQEFGKMGKGKPVKKK